MNDRGGTSKRVPLEIKLPLFTIALAVAIAAALALWGGEAIARSSGIVNHSGNPDTSDGLNCSTCHQGGPGETTVTIDAPDDIVGGETATITVTVSGGPGLIAGFNASFGDFAGVIASTGDDTQLLQNQITHTMPKDFANGEASFSFDWTAPNEGGPAVVYAAALSSNANGNPTGDDVGIATASIQVEAASLIGDVNCDGEANIVDALLIAQYDAGIREDGATCPLPNPLDELIVANADFNRNGTADIVDALLIARCDAGIAGEFCPDAG